MRGEEELPDLEREARRTRVSGWLVPLLALVGMAATIVGGLSAERMYETRLAVLLAEAHLDHARSLARYADRTRRITTDAQLVDAVRSLWTGSELPYEMVDVCLIAQDGRYLLHTGRPELVGRNTLEDRLSPPRAQLASVGDLLAKGVDWAGRQITGEGEAAVAAYAYEPDLGVLVGLQLRPGAVRRAVRRTGLPWFGVLALIAGVLVPLQLLVVHRAWREARDRVDRLRASERELQARLAAADRMVAVGTLAAGVAHEINNPLTYILGNLDQAAARLPSEPPTGPGERPSLGDLVEGARHGALRVHEVVRDLRVLTRDEARAAPEPFDPREAVERALRLVQGEVAQRGRLEAELSPVPRVLGQPGRLEQIVVNLVVNAAQALPEGGGRVAVTLTPAPDGQVELRVADDGAGMPPDVLERAFEPFFTTKPVGVGTGLGLHITRRLVENLGGRVEVQSKEGEGTTVRVRLPAMPGAAGPGAGSGQASGAAPGEAPGQAPSPAPPREPARGRVLFVDDARELGQLVRRLLGDRHDVVVCTTGEEALALLERDRDFDLVLCDLSMPGLGGLELYRELRGRYPALAERFVLTTGGRSEEVGDQETSELEVLEKPFRASQLEALLARAMNRN